MPANKDTIANLAEKAMELGASLQRSTSHAIAHAAVVDELYGVLDLLRSDASREAIQCSVEELIRQLTRSRARGD